MIYIIAKISIYQYIKPTKNISDHLINIYVYLKKYHWKNNDGSIHIFNLTSN